MSLDSGSYEEQLWTCRRIRIRRDLKDDLTKRGKRRCRVDRLEQFQRSSDGDIDILVSTTSLLV